MLYVYNGYLMQGGRVNNLLAFAFMLPWWNGILREYELLNTLSGNSLKILLLHYKIKNTFVGLVVVERQILQINTVLTF